MSCSITERVTENRAGPGGGPASPGAAAGAAGCRLRGSSNASLATSPNSRAVPSSTGSNAAQNGSQGASMRLKPCCLCWCCCYGCACNPGKGNDDSNDEDPPPTLDEMKSWGTSFDKLMRNPAGRKVFQNFLQCEYSEENILFWLACEDLKRETNPATVEEKARNIYEDYISILSNREVSLDSQVREIVNRNMVHPTKHTFDEAQLQIYTLMHRDSYPRFVNSSLYRKLTEPDKEEKHEQTSGGGGAEHDGPGAVG